MSPTRIPKQAASISPASLKRQEEVLPMAKLEQRRYKRKMRLTGQKMTCQPHLGIQGYFRWFGCPFTGCCP